MWDERKDGWMDGQNCTMPTCDKMVNHHRTSGAQGQYW